MMNFVFFIAVVLSGTWVYYDATKNNVGKIKNEKGMFNMSAGSWCVVTLFLWIVGFPAYVLKRKSLIIQAKESPVQYSQVKRTVVFVVLAAIAIGGVAVMYPSALSGSNKVTMIKGSTIRSCPHTIESMADVNFDSYTWKSGNTNGVEYVNLQGTISAGGQQTHTVLQFIFRDDGVTFQANALELNGKLQSQGFIKDFLRVMCNNVERSMSSTGGSKTEQKHSATNNTKASPAGSWVGSQSRMEIKKVDGENLYFINFMTGTESGCTGEIDGSAPLKSNKLNFVKENEWSEGLCKVEIEINGDKASVSSDNCMEYSGVSCGIYGELKRAN